MCKYGLAKSKQSICVVAFFFFTFSQNQCKTKLIVLFFSHKTKQNKSASPNLINSQKKHIQMPKLIKILRGRKSSLDVPFKKVASKSNGIFRRSNLTANHRSNNDKSPATEPIGKNQTTINPTITFSLSEDEEGSDIIHSPVSDIENQVHDTIGESNNNNNIIFTDSKRMLPPVETETKEIAIGTEDHEKTVTFTHLEIMRNELAHLMQLAEKDKEICNLRKNKQDLELSHDQAMEEKNQEIVKIRELLASVEAALSKVEEKYESVNKEHTKIIEVLMKTQYELYELKHSSPSTWMTPVWNFFI
jgi:hypothetical protein